MTNRSHNLLREFASLRLLWPYMRTSPKALLLACAFIPIVTLLQMGLPLALRHSVDEGVGRNDTTALLIGAAIYLILVVVEYLARGAQNIASAYVVHQMIRQLRDTLVRHILRMSPAYHDKTVSGTLVTRATSDFDSLSESLNQGVLTSVVDCAVILGCISGMIWLDWQLTLVVLALAPPVVFLVLLFSRLLKDALLATRVKIAALNGFSQEGLYGHVTVKLLNAYASMQKRFDRMNEEYRRVQMRSVILDALMFSVLEGAAAIVLGVALLTVVHDDARWTAGTLIAFVQYLQQIFEPLKQLGSKMAMLQGAFTAMERIFGILNTESRVEGTRTDVGPLRGCVELTDVSFSYAQAPGQERPVLDRVNLRIDGGTSVALIGRTGAGKSTVAKILTKMYGSYQGSIRIDGQELRDLEPAAFRRRLGIVPQDLAMFEGTIAFNIALDRPGLSRAAIEEAGHVAGVDRFVARLPGGYDFMVLEGGSNLSTGQKQLIAFARAIVTQPDILILDEATASVDPESELWIQEGLARIKSGRTMIMIAHRLDSIRTCDQVYAFGASPP